MGHDVFISYSADDRPIADEMCSTLESKGIRCWIAPRDILPGMDWGGSIIDAIGTSRVMVLLLSSNSNASEQVKREVERAVNKKVIVIPFRIEDVSLSPSLEYQLSLTHWMDALTPPMENHLERLAEHIQQLLSADAGTRGIPIPKRERMPVPGTSILGGGAGTRLFPLTGPSPHKRTYVYLGAGVAIGLIVLVGLLWGSWGQKTESQQVASATSSPSPAASPITTPAATPSANQSINNNAAAETDGRLRIPVIIGTAYDVARELLIREGWQPNMKHVSYGNDPNVQSGNGPTFWKRGYWELELCAGTGAAECRFEFIDPSERVLIVITHGEEADDGEYHAIVKRAVFKKNNVRS